MKWYDGIPEHARKGISGSWMPAPYNNIFIGSDPRDGQNKDWADAFDAIVNVSCTEGALFEPSRPDQRTYWYPCNEGAEWSYAYFFMMFKIIDHHYRKGDKVYIHCLPKDTEVLNEYGEWIPLGDIKAGENIVTYKEGNLILDTVNASFSRNLLEKEEVYDFKSSRLNRSITVTEQHRMAYNPHMGMEAKNIPNQTVVSNWEWSGEYISENTYDDNFLLLMTWVVGDGSLYDKMVSFHLKKQRKIDRICELANKCNFEFIVTPKNDGTTYIYIKDRFSIIEKFLTSNKMYPKDLPLKMSRSQGQQMVRELVMIDGDYENYKNKGAIRLNTKRKEDVDFYCSLIALHYGIATWNRVEKDSQFVDNHYMYYVNAIPLKKTQKCKSGFNNTKVLKKDSQYKGEVACISVSSGFFLARRNGITFVTGNCHAGAYRSPSIFRNWLVACENKTLEEANTIERGEESFKDDPQMKHFSIYQNYILGNMPPNYQEFIERIRKVGIDKAHFTSILWQPFPLNKNRQIRTKQERVTPLNRLKYQLIRPFCAIEKKYKRLKDLYVYWKNDMIEMKPADHWTTLSKDWQKISRRRPKIEKETK